MKEYSVNGIGMFAISEVGGGGSKASEGHLRRTRKPFPGNGLSVKKLICSLLLFSALCYWGAQARGETTVYFGDTNGSYPIEVDKNEEFLVVLWISSVVELAGYDAKITYSGPIALNASAAHGSWFADGHTITNSTIRGDAWAMC